MAMKAGKLKVRKRNYAKANTRKKAKMSKSMKSQVQKLINKNLETKTHYQTYSTSTYNDRDDILNVSQDIFGGIGQGAADGSAPGSNNRIGDSISARGVLFNFRITARNTFSNGSIVFTLPYVYVRLMIFTVRSPIALVGLPTKANMFDGLAMTVNTAPTRVPFSSSNYGYAKDILYNKVIKIRNDGLFVNNGIANETLLGNDFYFNKYVKYNKIIKYTDNGSGLQTNSPLFFSIIAETAPFLSTGMNTVVNPLCTISGYTKIYYKDA